MSGSGYVSICVSNCVGVCVLWVFCVGVVCVCL